MEEQPKRILLVEDDRFLRKAAEATLRRHGFAVSAAADGEEALLRAREGPDLILLDLIMPKLQGFEVLRILKQDPTTKQIPIVVLSNLGQESDVQQALQGGAVAYFIKANLSLQELVTKVQTLFTGGAIT
jgi:CheY-like chemotaxis protein